MLSEEIRDEYNSKLELCVERLTKNIPKELKNEFECVVMMARYGMLAYCEVMTDGEVYEWRQSNGVIRCS